MGEQDTEIWHERWRENRIGFHQGDVNKLLMKHWPALVPETSSTVFVPLCGKSLDMRWLAERGHPVLGVELSEIAVTAFFEENGMTFETSSNGRFEVFRSGAIELWCGDFFALTADDLRNCKAAYDRASLIALPPDLRRRYAAHMAEILDGGTTTLLFTIDYDPAEIKPPPFAVPDAEVAELYRDWADVLHLETRDAMRGSENLTERGLKAVTTSAFAITTRRDR